MMRSVTQARAAVAVFGIEALGNATLAVNGASFAAKEALVEVVHVEQPNLL